MSEQQEPIEAPTAGARAPISNIPFEERGFTTRQTRQILAAGKTRFFEEILPELESYLEGTRRIITGRSILAYRNRKLAEAPQKSAVGSRGTKQLHKSRSEKRRRRKSGAAV